jgi:hypothetical protein
MSPSADAASIKYTFVQGGYSDGASHVGPALPRDGEGNVWMGGFSTNPSPGGHVNLGDDDAWLAKYISGGLLLGTISFATTVGDVITDLTVGADGAAYAVGNTPGLAGRPKRGPYGYGQR